LEKSCLPEASSCSYYATKTLTVWPRIVGNRKAQVASTEFPDPDTWTGPTGNPFLDWILKRIQSITGFEVSNTTPQMYSATFHTTVGDVSAGNFLVGGLAADIVLPQEDQPAESSRLAVLVGIFTAIPSSINISRSHFGQVLRADRMRFIGELNARLARQYGQVM
jgi:hypothetical protein